MGLQTTAAVVFWASMAFLGYTYVGYPLLVFLLGSLFPKPVKRDVYEPTVSIVITAFNEEKDIRRKLENTLNLNYPPEKTQVIVASDCSSDRTDAIVKEFSDRGVLLVRQNHRGGKTEAQNLAVTKSTGEIIVFSDATSTYRENAIRELVSSFNDPSIGCVAGKLVYVDPTRSSVGTGAKSYWGYETLLKESESRACSLIGVSGCIYAARRSNYVPMYPEACSDFLIASVMYKQGLRTVYAPAAVCTEETNRRGQKEMKMRVRVISQTFTDLWRNRGMMNPLRHGFYSVQLFSHKLLRYSVPLFLVAAFLSSGIAAFGSALFLAMFVAQAAFYALAVLGWVMERAGRRMGPLALPLYFVLANAASAAGFLQFLRGERYAAWEPIRDSV